MVLCFSPREEPRYDSSKALAAERLLQMMNKEVAPTPKFSNWGPDSFHLPFVELLVGAIGALREVVMVEGAERRCVKELVGAAVSCANECKFCANAHSVCAMATGAQEATKFIKTRDPTLIADEHTRLVTEWALNIHRPQSKIIRKPPLNTAVNAAELIGTVFVMQYLNDIVDNFVTRRALPPIVPGFLQNAYEDHEIVKKIMDKMLAHMFRKKTLKGGLMYEIYNLLPEGPNLDQVILPDDLAWAKGSKHIENSFKFWSHVVDNASKRHIPESLTTAISSYMLSVNSPVNYESPRQWAEKVCKEELLPSVPMKGEREATWLQFLLILSMVPTKLEESGLLNEFKRHHKGEKGEHHLKEKHFNYKGTNPFHDKRAIAGNVYGGFC